MCQLNEAAQAAVLATQGADLTGAHSRDAEFASTLVRPDPSSWANHSHAKVNHYDMNLNIDFSENIISASVTYTVEAVVADPKVVSLDFKGQTLSSITVDGQSADYWISHVDGALGQSLVIRLPTLAIGEKASIVIDMKTAKDASAIQWLLPEQTATKKHPYLFTQCQAIHCRTLIPCQDSPGVKSSYSASVVVPAALTALMSAVIDNPAGEAVEGDDSLRTFTFQQKVPIPSYLIALAVGELEKRDISDRCAVWADPNFVDTCAEELSELDVMLQAAENQNGPYIWGRYDVLVLPPSFPYGGMENPCLTFATPSIIAGDKSLVNVILHEAQHSWSGNLVTNDTWESFFLNEGFTIFGERKLVGTLYGKDQKGLHSAIGWQDLKESVNTFGHDHPFTCLQVDLSNEKDPDDAFSSVPYEKGFTLLAYLESIVSSEIMECFLRAYFSKFSHQSINSNLFKSYFIEYMTENGVSEEQLGKIDWDTWFYKPGMPEMVPFDDSLALKSKNLASSLLTSTDAEPILAAEDHLSAWSASQKIVFLDYLNDAIETAFVDNKEEAEKKAIEWRDALLKPLENIFAETKNSEIRFRFLTICVRLGVDGKQANIKDFLGGIGRMKFVRPLYRDLFYSGLYREFAIDMLNELKDSYHSICAKMVTKDMETISAKPTRY